MKKSDYHSRIDRQIRIKGWDQEKLSNTKVVVIGAGATGNEVVKNLALLGIGNIMVIDSDIVEESNLSRTLFFNDLDIGKSKAEVITKKGHSLNPFINFKFIHGDVLFDVGLGIFRRSDLIISCLDNIIARSQTGLFSKLSNKPFLDCGIWEHGGEVRWFLPDSETCFDCTLDEIDFNRINERISCSGFSSQSSHNKDENQIIPSNVNPAAIIGGIVTQEVVHYLCDFKNVQGGKAITYNGLSLVLNKSTLRNNPDCLNHTNSPYEGIIELDLISNENSAYEVLKIAEQKFQMTELTLLLGREFVIKFICKNCGLEEQVNEHLHRVPEDKEICPKCHNKRDIISINSLNLDSDLIRLKLKDMGVPEGEILMVRSKSEEVFFELASHLFFD